MTRVAIIGNSHLAAFADAAEAIEARYPGVALSFFGLDNQLFFKSDLRKGKALRLADPPSENTRQVIDPKGAHVLDFAAFDLVLLTSHGFYLRHLFEALGSFNLLGLRALNDTGPLVSQACLRDAMAGHINAYTNRLRRFFPAAENMVVVQMPYPSTKAVEVSDALAGLQAQPDRQALFEMFNSGVHEHMFAKSLAYLPVPETAMADPFFSKPDLSRAAEMDPDAEPELTDYMHMNASYAALVFDELHRTILAG
ncbi:hypothetical protein [uncultured Tateyamaria sp.]|uniref:hypothetical protein n=1 Tax=uncultured Tateyamaria sp. TaxID=455651 RepID=UPI00260AC168|nr:hypothetical protein [uncultured Tateyamaria sp.]